MLFIHEQLKRGTYPNCTKLQIEIEAGCTRTILRDIEFMRDQLLLPIEYDPQRRGYYYTRPVENFPGVVVSESELFALLVAQKAVAHYKGTPFYRPLQTAGNGIAGWRTADHLPPGQPRGGGAVGLKLGCPRHRGAAEGAGGPGSGCCDSTPGAIRRACEAAREYRPAQTGAKSHVTHAAFLVHGGQLPSPTPTVSS